MEGNERIEVTNENRKNERIEVTKENRRKRKKRKRKKRKIMGGIELWYVEDAE